MKHSILLILCLASAFWSLHAQSPKDEAALKDLVDRMGKAQASYDSRTLDSLLGPDYIEISPAGEFDTRSKVLSFYTDEAKVRSQPSGLKVSIDQSFRSVRIIDETAIVIAELTYQIEQDDRTFPPRKLMLTAVCHKRNKNWILVSAQYTAIRPAAAPGSKPQ